MLPGQAWQRRELHEVWRISRQLACSGIGPKKRKLYTLGGDAPTMESPGPSVRPSSPSVQSVRPSVRAILNTVESIKKRVHP